MKKSNYVWGLVIAVVMTTLSYFVFIFGTWSFSLPLFVGLSVFSYGFNVMYYFLDNGPFHLPNWLFYASIVQYLYSYLLYCFLLNFYFNFKNKKNIKETGLSLFFIIIFVLIIFLFAKTISESVNQEQRGEQRARYLIYEEARAINNKIECERRGFFWDEPFAERCIPVKEPRF